MTDLFSSRAEVATSAPDRYAKQLLAHLGHRTTFTTTDNVSSASFAGGVGRVIVGDGLLALEAEAADRESLARVQAVLGGHLERFGQRNELLVIWSTSDHPGASAGTDPACAGPHRPERTGAEPPR